MRRSRLEEAAGRVEDASHRPDWVLLIRSDDALSDHHARRDERVKPLYDFTCELARLEPPPPHMQQLFAALRGNRDATNRFFSAITGSSPLPSFMNPDNLERILASAGTPLTHT